MSSLKEKHTDKKQPLSFFLERTEIKGLWITILHFSHQLSSVFVVSSSNVMNVCATIASCRLVNNEDLRVVVGLSGNMKNIF